LEYREEEATKHLREKTEMTLEANLGDGKRVN
jgi:hypothetical protein